MSVSGTIGTTTFNANRVVDHAFRRCRVPAQGITAEMQRYALDNLYLWLSSLANPRTPAWCIEKLVLPMYQGNPTVVLPIGTVDALNVNYRVLQTAEATVLLEDAASYIAATDTAVTTVGIKWATLATPVTFAASSDNTTWIPLATQATVAAVGTWTWFDLPAANAYAYFRIQTVDPTALLSYTQVVLGGLSSEIPMGLLNRDTFVAQSNKMLQSRPTTYWFQRDRANPILNLWPAPNAEAEVHQLVVWRHRHIMDTTSLQQDVEVPQRWMDAMIANLAVKVAYETPAVDFAIIPKLEQAAAVALQSAWEGDGDGSSTFIQPNIRGYTR